MFIDVSRYGFLEPIVAQVDSISLELERALSSIPAVREALLTDMAMDFPSNQWTWDNAINTAAVGYDLRQGSYTMFSLYKEGHDLQLARESFPTTLELIGNVEGMVYACISALAPGAHLHRHAHNRRHNIFHLLLNDLHGGRCEMLCGEERLMLGRKGDTALFDYSIPHESSNHAGNIRFNLMVDFHACRTA